MLKPPGLPPGPLDSHRGSLRYTGVATLSRRVPLHLRDGARRL